MFKYMKGHSYSNHDRALLDLAGSCRLLHVRKHLTFLKNLQRHLCKLSPQNWLWGSVQGLLMSHGHHGDTLAQLFVTSGDCCGPSFSPLTVVSTNDLVLLPCSLCKGRTLYSVVRDAKIVLDVNKTRQIAQEIVKV